mmetsp:Transcript_31935/g.70187  ORF Transcript_31935/g.70187 Transcript_31935/m.70187 type:complete len:199 (+) Transcript_31935:214-810(+)
MKIAKILFAAFAAQHLYGYAFADVTKEEEEEALIFEPTEGDSDNDVNDIANASDFTEDDPKPDGNVDLPVDGFLEMIAEENGPSDGQLRGRRRLGKTYTWRGSVRYRISSGSRSTQGQWCIKHDDFYCKDAGKQWERWAASQSGRKKCSVSSGRNTARCRSFGTNTCGFPQTVLNSCVTGRCQTDCYLTCTISWNCNN